MLAGCWLLAAGPRTNAVKIGEEQIITQSGAGVRADGYGGAGMGWHGLAGPLVTSLFSPLLGGEVRGGASYGEHCVVSHCHHHHPALQHCT